MLEPITVYDGTTEPGITAMLKAIEQAIQAAQADLDQSVEEENALPMPVVPVYEDLLGIDEEVYRQINMALRAGNQNLMFYGPPGTGKTTLALRVAATISEEWRIVTGSSDWTSQDIIGGYQPLSGGELIFQAGVLLEHFDKPLVFDELNRCDIDKVIGPLFTVLSGHSTTLPYRADPSSPTSQRIEITPNGIASPPQTFAPSSRWRLIATINSIDKASLYQMSYALTRRFAWIYVDVPRDKAAFIRAYVARQRACDPIELVGDRCPLADLWERVCKDRDIGPAPIIDIIRMIETENPAFDYFQEANEDSADYYLDGLFMFLLPMLDGILREQSEVLSNDLAPHLSLDQERRGKLQERLRTVAV